MYFKTLKALWWLLCCSHFFPIVSLLFLLLVFHIVIPWFFFNLSHTLQSLKMLVSSSVFSWMLLRKACDFGGTFVLQFNFYCWFCVVLINSREHQIRQNAFCVCRLMFPSSGTIACWLLVDWFSCQSAILSLPSPPPYGSGKKNLSVSTYYRCQSLHQWIKSKVQISKAFPFVQSYFWTELSVY